jgi:archaellum component FlaC
MNKKTQELIESLEGIRISVADCNKLVSVLKRKINNYFSDELQNDETPSGAKKRAKIKKELLNFANI